MLKRAVRQTGIAIKRVRQRKNPFALINSDARQQVWILRRKQKETLFRRAGFGAILISLLFLGSMVFNIVSNGHSAFIRTQVKLSVTIPQAIDAQTDYRKILHDALYAQFPAVTEREDRRELTSILSKGAEYDLRDIAARHPGQSLDIWLPVSGDTESLTKRSDDTRITSQQRTWIETLQKDGRLRKSFNSVFFTSADSQEPELAGIASSFIGSFFTIAICILCAFPLGVGTALYLEEFARKNWVTEILEININNLAAVPSIIYGLLGMAVYIEVMGMPRSSALVGGLVLALLILPVIVIATRNALRAVPKSIRYAALALGATPAQVAMHHTFIYALPGIMTGVILGIARALGETSPLLMIGMVAFIMDAPRKITDPATTLPVQIYLWSNNPEAGFVEKTAAAIMILLLVLAVVNALAAWVRKRFEIKW